MFDAGLYSQLFGLMRQILAQNQAVIGAPLGRKILDEHNPSDVSKQNNWLSFYNFVHNSAPSMGGLNNNTATTIIGEYIKQIAPIVNQTMSNIGIGGGNNGFTSGSLISNAGAGAFTTPAAPSAGDFYTDSGFAATPQPTQAPTPIPQPAQVVVQPAPQPVVHNPFTSGGNMTYHGPRNPMDEFDEEGAPLSPIETNDAWAGELPFDRTITSAEAFHLSSRDFGYKPTLLFAQHHLLESSDEMVVRTFFRVASESLLSSPFMAHIVFNQLDIIDAPSADFVRLQTEVTRHFERSQRGPLHRVVTDAVADVNRRSWTAIDRYLTGHINRALKLNARNSNNLLESLSIDSIEDLRDLMSPTADWGVTRFPRGRDALRSIVDNAIWSATIGNSGALYTRENDYPNHVLRTSPAMPYAIRGVYPDKDLIPNYNPGEEQHERFVARLESNLLNTKTMIASRRATIITNMLTESVHSHVTSAPRFFDGRVPGCLNLVHHRFDTFTPNGLADLLPYQLETLTPEARAERVQSFYEWSDQIVDETTDWCQDPTVGWAGPMSERPLADLTVNALRFGVDPAEYMVQLDKLSTMDTKSDTSSVILCMNANRPLRR